MTQTAPRRSQINFKIPADLRTEVLNFAKKRYLPVTSFILQAIREKMDREREIANRNAKIGRTTS